MVRSRFTQGTCGVRSRYCEGSLKVLVRFTRSTVNVHSRYGEGSLKVLVRFTRSTVNVHSRYCEGSLKVLVRFTRGTVKVRSRYLRGSFEVLATRYGSKTLDVRSTCHAPMALEAQFFLQAPFQSVYNSRRVLLRFA